MGAWPWGGAWYFVVHQDLLYAKCDYLVVRWTGSDWINLGFPGIGQGPCVYDSQVVASGAEGQRIHAWDGASWTPLGSSLGWSEGNALAVFDGKLFVGGYFFWTWDVHVQHIAAWDGSSWAGLGTSSGQGIGGWVNALAVYGAMSLRVATSASPGACPPTASPAGTGIPGIPWRKASRGGGTA